jgi:hypothetical protein
MAASGRHAVDETHNRETVADGGGKTMATDLTIILEDRPGTMADVGEALGKAAVNIEGMCGFPCEGEGIGHLLVKDTAAGAARTALEEIGVEVRHERRVLVLEMENRPGTLGEASRRIANAGVNADLVYLAAGNRLVLGVDDIDAARSAL